MRAINIHIHPINRADAEASTAFAPQHRSAHPDMHTPTCTTKAHAA